jgi:tetratricopeptide (TPR) repeat protein
MYYGVSTSRLPLFMFRSRSFFIACTVSAALLALVPVLSAAQAKGSPSTEVSINPKHAIALAKSGHCKEALPALKKSLLHITEKDLKHDAGFAGVRCAMFADHPDTAIDFLRFLNHEFPNDPDVLYLAVHTYSDLSTRASAALASTAPNSYQSLELNAEALEVQGKWDEAAKVYEQILKQDPNLPGVHYRLGRVLVSQPDFGPEVAERAKAEFSKELQIDPSNAGAEYVLGELAKHKEEWDEAVQHFSHAANLDASFGDAFVGWGGSLVSQKKFADAISPLESAVKLEPQNPAAHYLLAIAYARSGRKEDGDRQFAIQRQLTQRGAAGEEGSPQQQKPN